MAEKITIETIDRTANIILGEIKSRPKIGIILGSGFSSVSDLVDEPETIQTGSLPYWPRSTVQGHHGRVLIGGIAGLPVMVLEGRTHFYEGYSLKQVTFPVRVMKRMGVEILIVTNAAGAIEATFIPGDLMLITDHIALMGMIGLNPLIGPNIDELGSRFPDMSQIYDRQLMNMARFVAGENKMLLREGVYVGLSGPHYESPAELRFLGAVGASAVGMSTVAEVIVARHAGIRVLGISGISNKANLDGSTVTTHEEVLQAGNVISPKIKTLVFGVIKKMADNSDG